MPASRDIRTAWPNRGITAAVMCRAAMTGVEDAAARAEVEALDLAKQLAA